MILMMALAGAALLTPLPDSSLDRGPAGSSVTKITPPLDGMGYGGYTAVDSSGWVFRAPLETRSVVGEAWPVSAVAVAGEVDPWLGPDKVKHFFTAAFLQGSAYGSLRATNLGHGSSVLGASLATTAVGLLKEARDRRAGGRFSLRDLAWNTVGAAAATILLERTRR